MPNPFRKLSSRDPGGPLRSLVFFALFYLYLWLDVDLRLIYHIGGMIEDFPVFFRGWAFFYESVSHPGGPVEYLSAFLSQFLYYSWAGALVVTLLAWLICVCTGAFIEAVNSSRLRWVRFIPPILLLILYTKYTYHFVTAVALLMALLFVCLYLRITRKNKLYETPFCRRIAKWELFRLAVFLVLSVVLYYIAGGAYLLFAVLCVIYELLFGRRWRVGLLYLLSALFIPYVGGVFVFGVSVIDAFGNLLPLSWKIFSLDARKRALTVVYILYLFLPLTAIGLGFWRLFFRMPALSPGRAGTSKPNSNRVWLIKSLVLFVITGTAVFFYHDKKAKTLFAVDYYAYHKMWPQVLRAARRYPDNHFVIHAVNRALYHTGLLGYEMFSYPQHPDTLLLTAKEHNLAYWKKFGAYIDMGLINMAERELTVCLDGFGECPVILKRLALINMVKDDISAARIYLGALGKTLFHADWANSYLTRLRSDPNLSTDKQVQHLRSLMMDKDYDFIHLKIEDMLPDLLDKNRQNRMAFEYLMAWYLLTGQLDKFMQNLHRLDDFDYPDIPRLYEEAILIYGYRTRKAVDLHGRHISPQSHQRYKDFIQVYNRYGRNNQAALNDLMRDYGDSYFFYYIYGYSGKRK